MRAWDLSAGFKCFTDSPMENHAQDIKLSTLEKVASALGKRLQVKIA